MGFSAIWRTTVVRNMKNRARKKKSAGARKRKDLAFEVAEMRYVRNMSQKHISAP
jgi:hypothetical protein